MFQLEFSPMVMFVPRKLNVYVFIQTKYGVHTFVSTMASSVAASTPKEYLNPDWPPLCIAARLGDLAKCKVWIERGEKHEPTPNSSSGKDGGDDNCNHNETPLFLAAKYGHYDVCKYLLENGATHDANDEGETPLHIAVRQQHLDVVRLLLENGADSTKRDNEEMTPLLTAIQENDVSMTKLLLERGRVYEMNDDDKREDLKGIDCNEYLWHAADTNNQELCEVLFEHGQKLRSEEDGAIVLCISAADGNVDLCRFFLKHGAKPVVSKRWGTSALHTAAGERHLEVCKLLMEEVSVDIEDDDAQTPFEIAGIHGYVDVCNLLWPATKGVEDLDYKWPRLCIAARVGDVTKCKKWIEAGEKQDEKVIDCSTQDREETPLYLAAKYGHYDVCKLLLEKGATHDANEEFLTPLLIAARHGHVRVCRLLLENGASDDRVLEAYTPLLEAVSNGHLEVAKLLLERKTDESDDSHCRSPLHIAVFDKNHEMTRLILEKSQDVEELITMDTEGETPFHVAIENNDIEMVKLLLEHGAVEFLEEYDYMRLAARNSSLATCRLMLKHGYKFKSSEQLNSLLCIAASEGSVKFCQWLLNQGATPAKDSKALYKAAEEGHFDVCRLLLMHGAVVDEGTRGSTPYDVAKSAGHTDVCKLLMPDLEETQTTQEPSSKRTRTVCYV